MHTHIDSGRLLTCSYTLSFYCYQECFINASLLWIQLLINVSTAFRLCLHSYWRYFVAIFLSFAFQLRIFFCEKQGKTFKIFTLIDEMFTSQWKFSFLLIFFYFISLKCVSEKFLKNKKVESKKNDAQHMKFFRFRMQSIDFSLYLLLFLPPHHHHHRGDRSVRKNTRRERERGRERERVK